MMNVTSVKRIHQSDWTDSGVRFLRARDIVAAAKNEEPDDYLYISKEKYEEYSTLSGKVGVSDLLVTGVGTIGVPYLVRNLEPLYFKDGNIIWFQNLDKIDGKFLFYSFSAEQIQGFINESAGIGTVGTYTIESGKKTPISLPNQIEQAKVGEFFQQLDNLITLHQRQPFLQSPPDISLIVQLTPPFYTFSWEQRKLGELVDRVVRKNINNESTLPLTISAQYGLVDQITYFNNRVASRDVSNYYLVLNGEFAYNKSTSDGYPFGAVKRLDLYEKGVLSTLYIVFAPKKEQQIDSDYLTVFFDTDRWHKGVAERAAEGARNHGLLNISAEDFFDIDLSVPKDIVEQKQIGAFIRQLDDLITLHQRKFEKLTNVKKSMLEKMFPQNGSSYPEIRFKGFTDPWEQRKLSEITDKVTEKNAGLQYVETFTNSAEFGIISQRDFFDHDIAKLGSLDGYYIVKTEDFVYNPRISTSAPVGPINRNKLGRTGVMSPLYTVFRPHDIDTTYLEYFFKCGYWHSFMNFNGDSGARSDRFSIRDNVFFQMPIPIPNIDEQRKIGELLTCLDNLITLHQRELEKLQNIKKSMLEKMFV